MSKKKFSELVRVEKWCQEQNTECRGNPFYFPWPPSVNHYWKTTYRRGRPARAISTAGIRFKNFVRIEVARINKRLKLDGDVKLNIKAFPPDKRQRDIDNLLKAICDSLTGAEVYVDDCLVSDLRIARGTCTEMKGYVAVEVVEV